MIKKNVVDDLRRLIITLVKDGENKKECIILAEKSIDQLTMLSREEKLVLAKEVGSYLAATMPEEGESEEQRKEALYRLMFPRKDND